MAQLTWTPQALNDVDAICRFIARDAPCYAQLFATQVQSISEGTDGETANKGMHLTVAYAPASDSRRVASLDAMGESPSSLR